MPQLFNSGLNKEYYVNVQPYPSLGFKKRRWLVSPNNLHLYIGRDNAKTALLKARNMTTDKLRLKFRSFGIIDFYLK